MDNIKKRNWETRGFKNESEDTIDCLGVEGRWVFRNDYPELTDTKSIFRQREFLMKKWEEKYGEKESNPNKHIS